MQPAKASQAQRVYKGKLLMAIASEQQILDERADYVNPFQVERGGILSLTTLSGIQYVTYEPNPTQDTIPIGLQQHDQEEVDLFRAVAPWRTRRAYPEFTPFPYAIQGTLIVNSIHPDADPALIMPGAPFYLGPSGTITTSSSFNSRKLGVFDSALNCPSLRVPGGLGQSTLRVAGNAAIVNPDSVYIQTAGWARIRLHIR